MKKKSIINIRKKTIKELEKMVSEKKLGLLLEEASFKSGKTSNPKKKRQLKSEVATAMTIIREKELVQASKDNSKTEKTTK